MQLLPEQQGWFAPPHDWQVCTAAVVLHKRLAPVQVVPLQQSCPADAPQATQSCDVVLQA